MQYRLLKGEYAVQCSKCGKPTSCEWAFCEDCGFPLFNGQLSFIKIYIVIYAIFCFFAALLSIDSQWIFTFQLQEYIFGSGALAHRVIFGIDNIMSIVYWVILSFAIGTMVCVNKYWAISKTVVPVLTVAFSVAPSLHLILLSREKDFPGGSTLGVLIFLAISIVEIRAVIKKWLSVSMYFRR